MYDFFPQNDFKELKDHKTPIQLHIHVLKISPEGVVGRSVDWTKSDTNWLAQLQSG